MRRTVIPAGGLVELTRCTPVSAHWCPVHGECLCPRTEDGDILSMDDDGCPLHSRRSAHPIRTAIAI